MSLQKITVYKIICDSCGKPYVEKDEWYCFETKKEAEDIIGCDVDNEWWQDGDKFYCDDCKWEQDKWNKRNLKTKGGGR